MTLTQLTTMANNFTDENVVPTVTMNYANSAISGVNIALKTSLPYFDDNVTNYIGLSDDWLQTVVIPYMCWAIKMNDSSINEAREFLFQYEKGLRVLKQNKKTAIPTDYQGTGFRNVYPITNYNGM
jgi:hypothetical protein